MMVEQVIERRKRARLHIVQPVLEPVDEPDLLHDDSSLDDCPSSFLCPLTMEIMFDPVLDSDGNTYERRALLEWLKENRTSPISRQPLNDRMVIPNIALREAIHEFMGSEWVNGKKGEETQERGAVETSEIPNPSLDNIKKSPSPLRAKVDSYLGHAAKELCNANLRLNDEGCCAFRYDNITIVLDVPDNVGIFCFYTRDLIADEDPTSLEKVYQRALESNFLQVETRGGCLAIRNHDDGRKELVFSYTDRVREVTSKDFTNILRSFIETILTLRERLTRP